LNKIIPCLRQSIDARKNRGPTDGDNIAAALLKKRRGAFAQTKRGLAILQRLAALQTGCVEHFRGLRMERRIWSGVFRSEGFLQGFDLGA
jgi:hypothetical protein